MIKKIALAAVLAATSAAAANAATVYASSVVSFNQVGPVAADRSTPEAALGAADGTFVSLGFGGSIVLGFDKLVSGVGSITEVTYNISNYFENALVSTSLDGVTWSDAIAVSNQVAGGVTTVDAGTSPFKFIQIVDTSTPFPRQVRDGFDIDGVGFEEYVPAPVPLPAAGLMLLGGLAGMGGLALRRKKA